MDYKNNKNVPLLAKYHWVLIKHGIKMETTYLIKTKQKAEFCEHRFKDSS